MDKNIPLSELIRIGARQHPQCFSALRRDTPHGTGTCAIGAAYVGKFGELPAWDLNSWKALVLICPELALNGAHWDLALDIVEMNDGVRMTREAIADSLKGRGL